ncbi:visual pigment-like receptor peropsin [Diadema setosum]|uniref:visual pigment-like receptor peropsin n=1 Tax=Diadema setosum TaxID=31175 RepID=UPI003B3AFAD7
MDNLTSNITDPSETWPDFAHILAGFYLTIVFFVALLGNSLVLFLFAWDATLRTPTNMFLLSLSISDWLVTVAGIPFVTVSIYAQRWMFSFGGCVAYAFLMTFLGLTSLLSHAAIAIDRYLVITKPHFGIIITYPKALGMIAVTWLWSLMWAICPLAGWGEYDYEGTGAWCSLLWNSNDVGPKSYVLAMFVLTFIVTVGVMVYCYTCIFLTMHRLPILPSRSSILERNRKSRETKLLKTLIFIAFGFFVAWTPYAVVSLVAIFAGSDFLSVTAMTLPSLFAKGSVLLNPIIYAVTSRVFRASFRNMAKSLCPACVVSMLPRPKSVSTPDNSGTKRTRMVKGSISSGGRDSQNRGIKADDSTSILVAGGHEICASPKIPPAGQRRWSQGSSKGGRKKTEPQKRSSVSIEMERLQKLLPGKQRRRGSKSFRPKESDVPEHDKPTEKNPKVGPTVETGVAESDAVKPSERRLSHEADDVGKDVPTKTGEQGLADDVINELSKRMHEETEVMEKDGEREDIEEKLGVTKDKVSTDTPDIKEIQNSQDSPNTEENTPETISRTDGEWQESSSSNVDSGVFETNSKQM